MRKIWIAPFVIASAGCLPQDVDDSSSTESITSDIAHDGEHRGGGHGNDRDCTWDQWGQSASHDGSSCARGQRAKHTLARQQVDLLVDQEIAEVGGDLLVHYQVPLSDDDGNVFVEEKGGTYISCDPPGIFDPSCGLLNPQLGQVFRERGYRWHGDRLDPAWTFESDWHPYPVFFFESMFQPALSGDYLYIPGAGGSVFKVNKHTGQSVRRINPFPTIDPNTYVVGGVTVDRDGNVYWNTRHHEPTDFFGEHGWLVKVTHDGRIRMFSYDNVPGAKAPTDLCNYSYDNSVEFPAFPWPPANTPPPQYNCGSQTPPANLTPAIGRDGTIYTASRGRADAYGFALALDPDLSVKWSFSLRDRIADGCGVSIPYGDDPNVSNECRPGTPVGLDPFTGEMPALVISDQGSSAPVPLPDGGVLFGSDGNTNFSRGHMLKLDRHGNLAGIHDFGWDITPAIYEHDRTYSIILKNNHYVTNGPYELTQISANLEQEWTFVNTSTQTCSRQPDGTVSCVDDGAHPNGFEWCINAPAVDRDGTVYGINEDGNFYAIEQGGRLRDKVFLESTRAAAYTPLSIDRKGRLYSQNNGVMTVLGEHGH